MLVSAATRPQRKRVREGRLGEADGRWEPFPTEVDLRCGDRGWLEALGGSRHYLYPVHISHTFISCPSVGAALYLLLLRLLARQYDAAARVAPLCVSDATLSAEEAQLASPRWIRAHEREQQLGPPAGP